MDNEHVLEVLHGTFHPVVEGRGPLGVFQVELVNGLQLLLRFLRKETGEMISSPYTALAPSPLAGAAFGSPPALPAVCGSKILDSPTDRRSFGTGH